MASQPDNELSFEEIINSTPRNSTGPRQRAKSWLASFEYQLNCDLHLPGRGRRNDNTQPPLSPVPPPRPVKSQSKPPHHGGGITPSDKRALIIIAIAALVCAAVLIGALVGVGLRDPGPYNLSIVHGTATTTGVISTSATLTSASLHSVHAPLGSGTRPDLTPSARSTTSSRSSDSLTEPSSEVARTTDISSTTTTTAETASLASPSPTTLLTTTSTSFESTFSTSGFSSATPTPNPSSPSTTSSPSPMATTSTPHTQDLPTAHPIPTQWQDGPSPTAPATLPPINPDPLSLNDPTIFIHAPPSLTIEGWKLRPSLPVETGAWGEATREGSALRGG